MNAERLHAVLVDLLEKSRSALLVKSLNAITSALHNIVNAPSETSHQTTFNSALETMRERSKNTPSADLSPGWRDIIDELRLSHLLPEVLLNNIHSIVSRNAITPGLALDEINSLKGSVQKSLEDITKIVEGFQSLDIEKEILPPGHFELGIQVPRSEVDNELKEFADELRKLDKIFIVFSEIETGSREDFKIRSISSSELSVFVEAVPKVAAAIAAAIAFVIHEYKNILEIKVTLLRLEELKVPKQQIDNIGTHSNTNMEHAIERYVHERMQLLKLEEHRKKELHQEMLNSMREIALRIDRGFNFDVRAGDPPQTQQGEVEAPTDDGELDPIRIVHENRDALRFVKHSSERILALPNGDNEDNGGPEDGTPLERGGRAPRGTK